MHSGEMPGFAAFSFCCCFDCVCISVASTKSSAVASTAVPSTAYLVFLVLLRLSLIAVAARVISTAIMVSMITSGSVQFYCCHVIALVKAELACNKLAHQRVSEAEQHVLIT